MTPCGPEGPRVTLGVWDDPSAPTRKEDWVSARRRSLYWEALYLLLVPALSTRWAPPSLLEPGWGPCGAVYGQQCMTTPETGGGLVRMCQSGGALGASHTAPPPGSEAGTASFFLRPPSAPKLAAQQPRPVRRGKHVGNQGEKSQHLQVRVTCHCFGSCADPFLVRSG